MLQACQAEINLCLSLNVSCYYGSLNQLVYRLYLALFRQNICHCCLYKFEYLFDHLLGKVIGGRQPAGGYGKQTASFGPDSTLLIYIKTF